MDDMPFIVFFFRGGFQKSVAATTVSFSFMPSVTGETLFQRHQIVIWKGDYFQMRMIVFLNHIEGNGYKTRTMQWIIFECALIFEGSFSLLCS